MRSGEELSEEALSFNPSKNRVLLYSGKIKNCHNNKSGDPTKMNNGAIRKNVRTAKNVGEPRNYVRKLSEAP